MIGSIIGGLIGKGGADAAAGMAQQGGSQAYAANNAQMDRNYAATSPYTAAGQGAIGILGQLLGYGTLTGNANGIGSSFQPDPNSPAQGRSTMQNALKAMYGDTPQLDEIKTPWNFEADPGYQFRRDEGLKALDRTAAAKGKLLSGAQFKAASDYNSGLASQEYGNWWDRYTGSVNFNNAKRQQDYGNRFGQANNYLTLLSGQAGLGSGAAGTLTGANTGLSTASGNALVNSANAAGQYTMAGANALASGIGNGINNALTGAYLAFNPTSGFFTGGKKSAYGGTAP